MGEFCKKIDTKQDSTEAMQLLANKTSNGSTQNLAESANSFFASITDGIEPLPAIRRPGQPNVHVNSIDTSYLLKMWRGTRRFRPRSLEKSFYNPYCKGQTTQTYRRGPQTYIPNINSLKNAGNICDFMDKRRSKSQAR